jgi:hypothetical protein
MSIALNLSVCLESLFHDTKEALVVCQEAAAAAEVHPRPAQ